MRETIELDFVIKGYPGTGRRVEAESDLSQVYRPDLLQGAFMGDAVMLFGNTDLSPRFGWVTLIDWCLRLSGAVAELKVTDEKTVRFSESDDFISFRRSEEKLHVSTSYEPGTVTVPFDAFVDSVRDFVESRLDWIAANFPDAMRNPAMPDVLSRIGQAFPPRTDDSDGGRA
ncbi:hypothetical protein OG905_00260 [Streptomyces sp. NBC_00322]|uniref:hypothetical protein n=1 Tax=Streptomyces sp. NBC_00322 TaxID=2975712 RepID=UPI002E2842A4|nr:hypothetical protein [Streptomyces sp. NBC_00322]